MTKQKNSVYAKLLPSSLLPLILGCYFFPLCFATFFLNAEHKGQTAFMFSIGAVVLAAFFIFLRLKKWEHDFHQFVRQNIPKNPTKVAVQEEREKEKEKEVEVNRAKAIHEEFLKEKEVEIVRLAQAHDLLVKEKEELVKEFEVKKFQHSQAVNEKNEALQSLDEKLSAKDELLQKKDETIAEQQRQIANLNFEMKTLLKLETQAR